MTPPLPPLPAPEAESVPADRPLSVSRGIDRRASQKPPFPVVRGKQPGPGNGTRLLLSQPFIVEDLSDDEGPIFVASPLKYLRFDRDSGCCVDHPVHSKPNSLGGQYDHA
ncbi:hypothetical protein [Sphingopyxis sp. PET50]|uniref:hypothetical protein n=1 Tax=Sphingopyxis sp. PET50 TaxID=2976533 RepID=UPI0021AFD28F|nr:hypothetical protein [Sphingopyxis sp. PET50]